MDIILDIKDNSLSRSGGGGKGEHKRLSIARAKSDNSLGVVARERAR